MEVWAIFGCSRMHSPGEGGRKLPFRIVGPWPGTLLVQPSCSPSTPVSIWSLGIPWSTMSLIEIWATDGGRVSENSRRNLGSRNLGSPNQKYAIVNAVNARNGVMRPRADGAAPARQLIGSAQPPPKTIRVVDAKRLLVDIALLGPGELQAALEPLAQEFELGERGALLASEQLAVRKPPHAHGSCLDIRRIVCLRGSLLGPIKWYARRTSPPYPPPPTPAAQCQTV